MKNASAPFLQVQRRMITSVVPLCLRSKTAAFDADNGANRRALADSCPSSALLPGGGANCRHCGDFQPMIAALFCAGAKTRPVHRIFNMESLYSGQNRLSRGKCGVTGGSDRTGQAYSAPKSRNTRTRESPPSAKRPCYGWCKPSARRRRCAG